MADHLVDKAISKAISDSSAEDFLAGWANKWSAKDADGYFNLYASDFTPSYGPARSLSHWARQRRTVVQHNTNVRNIMNQEKAFMNITDDIPDEITFGEDEGGEEEESE